LFAKRITRINKTSFISTIFMPELKTSRKSWKAHFKQHKWKWRIKGLNSQKRNLFNFLCDFLDRRIQDLLKSRRKSFRIC